METQELVWHLSMLNTIEQKRINEIRKEIKCERDKVLNEWAREHSKFDLGDIIKAGDIIIRVEYIFGRLGLRNVPFVEYVGHVLTRKLKDRADNWVTSIPDDSPSRNVIKLK